MNATRKLVDSNEEQELLEDLIESVKPRRVGESSLHYLLHTPFRYPPLKHGSRFGTRTEPSLWYGSKAIRSAFAESAYYRFLFRAGTRATLEPTEVDVTAYQATVRTRHGVDLTESPFDVHRGDISSPTHYDAGQQLGADMRASGVEAFRYGSARDPEGGANVALFTPRAFAVPKPDTVQTWRAFVTDTTAEFALRDVLRAKNHAFTRATFEVDGVLPAPAP